MRKIDSAIALAITAALLALLWAWLGRYWAAYTLFAIAVAINLPWRKIFKRH
jgi:hypothetical protein